MTDLKYAVLGYDNLHQGTYNDGNYGDEIQSVAATHCLPRVNTVIDRNELNQFSSPDKHLLLMNGFFGSGGLGADAFPPSNDIVPIYFSFHISNSESSKAFFTSPKCLEHFKKWEPIGCRDRGTKELLGSKGINAFFSKCLTLTFDKRPALRHKGKLFIVDGGSLTIPEHVLNANVVQRVTHLWKGPYPGHQASMKSAQHLLDLYKHEANGVITSRLHCALPCRAMGIPVIFLPPLWFGDYGRVSIYADVGGKMPPVKAYSRISSSQAIKFFPHFLKRLTLRGEAALRLCRHELYKLNFDWEFDSIEFESEKKIIRRSLQEQIEIQLSKM